MRVDRPTDRPEDLGESADRPEARPQAWDLRDANGLNAAEYTRAWNEKVRSGEAEKEQADEEPPRRDVDLRDSNGMTAAELRFLRNKRIEEAETEGAPDAPEPEPAHEGDDKPEKQREFKTLTEEFGESRSFSTFDAARKASIREHGPRPGQDLHHIVERSQARPERSGFTQEQIHSSDNLGWLDRPVHNQVSARYSRKPFGESAALRDLMNGESWEDQYETGLDVVNEEMEKYRDRDD